METSCSGLGPGRGQVAEALLPEIQGLVRVLLSPSWVGSKALMKAEPRG